MTPIVSQYLDLLDLQREAAFIALDGISDEQLWQRPAPKEWSIGEILDHNYLLFASFYPMIVWMWKYAGWYGRLRRSRRYETKIADCIAILNFRNGSGSCGLHAITPANPFHSSN